MTHRFIGLLVAVWIFSGPLQAARLQNFEVRFQVDGFGMKLGTATQKLQCETNQCKLVSDVVPSGLARLFVHEKTRETINLHQSDDSLDWLGYRKETLTFDDRPKGKTRQLIKTDQQPPRIHYPEDNRYWDYKKGVFDVVSIVYAMQFRKMNHQSLDGLVLQNKNHQQDVIFKQKDIHKKLKLAGSGQRVKTRYYEFNTSSAEVKIWLLSDYGFFPGRIEVYKPKKDRKIVMLLTADSLNNLPYQQLTTETLKSAAIRKAEKPLSANLFY